MPIEQIIYAEDRSDGKMAKNLLPSCESMLFFVWNDAAYITLLIIS